MSEGFHTFEYALDDRFFAAIDGEEVKRGSVAVTVLVNRTSTSFEMDFDLNGTVQIPCTRCLDDMNQEVNTHDRLIVKFGRVYSEESDEIVIIPETDGEINIAWFLYEFIALAIPIKHVHPGECNRVVSSSLGSIGRSTSMMRMMRMMLMTKTLVATMRVHRGRASSA